MNIKQIIYLSKVVEHGSLSSAAKELYVTVQAISKAIADLERELGQSLFVRGSRGMQPTDFGALFYRKAQGVIAGFCELESFSRTYVDLDGMPDRLRLALNTPAFPGNELVRENTVAFMKSQLGIDISYDLATGEAGYEGLVDGSFDALVTVGAFRHADVDCRPVGTVPAGVMMGSRHPLATKDVVALDDLAPYPIARSSWFDRANDTIVESYRKREAHLNFVELALDDVAKFLGEGGLVLTTGIPALGRTSPLLTVRLLASEDAVAVPICVVCLKDRGAATFSVVEKLRLSGGLPFLK